jgi:hypothetical protein
MPSILRDYVTLQDGGRQVSPEVAWSGVWGELRRFRLRVGVSTIVCWCPEEERMRRRRKWGNWLLSPFWAGPDLVGEGDEFGDGVAGGLFGEEGVAGADAGEDEVVVVDAVGPGLGGGAEGEGADGGEGEDGDEELAGLLGEEGVAGEFAEAEMERQVGFEGAADVALEGGLPHGFDSFGEGRDVRVVAGEEAGGESFKDFADLVGLRDVFAGEARYAGAAAGFFANEAFGDEEIDGLTDRGLGGAEALAPLGFRNDLAGLQGAAQDLLAEFGGDLRFDEIGAGSRRWGEKREGTLQALIVPEGGKRCKVNLFL